MFQSFSPSRKTNLTIIQRGQYLHKSVGIQVRDDKFQKEHRKERRYVKESRKDNFTYPASPLLQACAVQHQQRAPQPGFSLGRKSSDCQTLLWTLVPGLPLQTQVPGLSTETQVPFTHAPSLLACRLWHCSCPWTLAPSLLVCRPWLHACLCTLPASLPESLDGVITEGLSLSKPANKYRKC